MAAAPRKRGTESGLRPPSVGGVGCGGRGAKAPRTFFLTAWGPFPYTGAAVGNGRREWGTGGGGGAELLPTLKRCASSLAGTTIRSIRRGGWPYRVAGVRCSWGSTRIV